MRGTYFYSRKEIRKRQGNVFNVLWNFKYTYFLSVFLSAGMGYWEQVCSKILYEFQIQPTYRYSVSLLLKLFVKVCRIYSWKWAKEFKLTKVHMWIFFRSFFSLSFPFFLQPIIPKFSSQSQQTRKSTQLSSWNQGMFYTFSWKNNCRWTN